MEKKKAAPRKSKRKVIIYSAFSFGIVLAMILAFSLIGKKSSLLVFPNRSGEVRDRGNNTPEIVSASIYPEKATAASQLVAHYNARDPENDVMQITFRWYVDNQLVQDGTLGSLNPGKLFKNSTVYVELFPSDSSGEGKPFRTSSIIIGNQPPSVKSIALTPLESSVGAIITATPEGIDADGDQIKYLYQWKVNGKFGADQSERNQFDTKTLHKHDIVSVVVTPSDWDLTGAALQSENLMLVNRPPQITSLPTYGLENGVYQYKVNAIDPDGDKLSYSLEKSPQGMTIDSSTGLIQWTLPQLVSSKLDVPIKLVVDDGDRGRAVQEFSLTLEMQ